MPLWMQTVKNVKWGVDSLWANSVLFAAPTSSYSPTTFYGEMCYIPKKRGTNLTALDYVPCLFIRCASYYC